MIELPGWDCLSCRAFNGSAKEILPCCRCCGADKPSAFVELEPLSEASGSWTTHAFVARDGDGL